ncbi:geranylgeranylglyceryl/heptaprenylglyceryl phosphate synthase [Zunongwangia sp. F363]|uniref:Geranylgeranylglyceryl phosphate synthase n=1 Tax=Autumnicola tepida TaxID=3075595 RepID=A0ABU3C4F5_9FLAO|nr:geranylgeranylglyceryl/heptaprenylglyceryl phosphate synthase [Zunongwangia sp. F363]MDT0641201.1 geranylgeranylglyceryl/heptaprenylglyceryl phosphate synthase [Zunongwangia sp. F363]
MSTIYSEFLNSANNKLKRLCILVDPDKFANEKAGFFLKSLPVETSFIFVGGSTVAACKTEATVKALKEHTHLPILLFPGDYTQITEEADGILFLSLLSGRNPEYLIGQQIKSVSCLRSSNLEIIPTGYILIDGGKESAVKRVSKTLPLPQEKVQLIVDTALAGQYLGKQLIYLEAGSGANFPVSEEIIAAVRNAIDIPLIAGGGIRNTLQLQKSYEAGADLVVIGTAFEDGEFSAEASNLSLESSEI